MINMDKKEWKKSINVSATGDYKKNGGGKELQPLSPSEDLNLILTGLSSRPPFYATFNRHNNNHRVHIQRLRHVSEPTSCTSSDNDDHENLLGNGAILVSAVSRRTLFDIVALLNLSYPDYDFSQTKSSCFSLVSYQDCVENVDGKFSATVNNYGNVREEMWKVINEEIKVNECIIYSYIPSYGGDPFTDDGCIWSFNYLFYNKSLKRFLFFACRALRSEQSDRLDLSSEQLWGTDAN